MYVINMDKCEHKDLEFLCLKPGVPGKKGFDLLAMESYQDRGTKDVLISRCRDCQEIIKEVIP